MKLLCKSSLIPVACAVSLWCSPANATPKYQCHPSVKPLNAQLGKRGQYEVKEGLKSRKYYGFLDRKKATPKNGCFFSGLTSGQCLVVEYKAKAYKKTSLVGQCVLSASGQEFRKARPNRSGSLREHAVLLKCGNKTSYKCDAGSNSKRRRKLKKQLEGKGRLLWSFCARGANNKLDKNIGKKVFCQLFDRKSNKAVFAAEFTWKQL